MWISGGRCPRQTEELGQWPPGKSHLLENSEDMGVAGAEEEEGGEVRRIRGIGAHIGWALELTVVILKPSH